MLVTNFTLNLAHAAVNHYTVANLTLKLAQGGNSPYTETQW